MNENTKISLQQKAIYKKCLECSGNNKNEIELCELTDCPLWEFRTIKTANMIKHTCIVKKCS